MVKNRDVEEMLLHMHRGRLRSRKPVELKRARHDSHPFAASTAAVTVVFSNHTIRNNYSSSPHFFGSATTNHHSYLESASSLSLHNFGDDWRKSRRWTCNVLVEDVRVYNIVDDSSTDDVIFWNNSTKISLLFGIRQSFHAFFYLPILRREKKEEGGGRCH
ncbi:hypothetical protein HN51_053761 [Arachis hypogaea]